MDLCCTVKTHFKHFDSTRSLDSAYTYTVYQNVLTGNRKDALDQAKISHPFRVCIPDGTCELHPYAFSLVDKLVGVCMPCSIILASHSVLKCIEWCVSLREVQSPDLVTYIPQSCFRYCVCLCKVQLPRYLITLEEMPFVSVVLKTLSSQTILIVCKSVHSLNLLEPLFKGSPYLRSLHLKKTP